MSEISPRELQILGFGVRSALGSTSLQLVTGYRSGLRRPRLTPYENQKGKEIRMNVAGGLERECEGEERRILLLASALADAAGDGGKALPLFLALPPLLPVAEGEPPPVVAELDAKLLTRIQQEAGISLDLSRSRVFRTGHAGGVEALQAAQQAGLGAGEALVAGVDSYYDQRTIALADAEKRLFESGKKGGMIPGEGAAVLRVGTQATHDARPSQGRILATVVGSASESFLDPVDDPRRPRPKKKKSKENEAKRARAVSRGRAMATLVRDLLANSSEPIKLAIVDANGERRRMREWLVTEATLDDGVKLERPAELWGDLGAATVPMSLAMVAGAWTARAWERETVLITACSHGDPRGALVFAPPKNDAEPEPQERTEPAVVSPAHASLDVALDVIERYAAKGKSDPEAFRALYQAAVSMARHKSLDDELIKHVDAVIARANAMGETAGEPFDDIAALMLEARPSAIESVVAAQRARQAPPAPVARKPFRASDGAPRLHDVDVDVIPFFAQDDGEDPHELRALVDAHIGEVARLGFLRLSQLGLPFSPYQEDFDQRLLSHVDAIAALGMGPPGRRVEPLSRVWALASEEPSSEALSFAQTLIVASFRDPLVMRAVIAGISVADVTTLDAHAHALSLAGHPEIAFALERLLFDHRPRFVELALEVLWARRQVSPLARLCLEHPNARVRRMAARALAVSGDEEATTALQQAVLEDPDDLVVVIASEALVRRGAAAGMHSLRELAARLERLPGELDPRAFSMLSSSLAAIGDGTDARLVELAANEVNDPTLLGWFGQVTNVTGLIQGLPNTTDVVEPDGPEERSALALTRLLGDPVPATEEDQKQHRPMQRKKSEASDTIMDRPTWRNHWNRVGGSMSTGKRYRFGEPYVPAASAEELARAGVTRTERERTELELSVALGERHVLWLDDWTTHQNRVLEDLKKRAEGTPYQAGQWLGARFTPRR